MGAPLKDKRGKLAGMNNGATFFLAVEQTSITAATYNWKRKISDLSNRKISDKWVQPTSR
jgi:hypothetical protein